MCQAQHQRGGIRASGQGYADETPKDRQPCQGVLLHTGAAVCEVSSVPVVTDPPVLVQ